MNMSSNVPSATSLRNLKKDDLDLEALGYLFSTRELDTTLKSNIMISLPVQFFILFWPKGPDDPDCCLLDSPGFLLGASDHPEHPPEQGLVVLHVGADGLVRVRLASAGALQLVVIDPETRRQ